MNNNKSKKNGFTLIELLVVVLVIGILASIALPKYLLARQRSQYSGMMQIAKSIFDAQERFYLANSYYSSKFQNLDIDLPNSSVSYSFYDKMIFPWGYCWTSSIFGSGCYNTNLGAGYYLYCRTESRFPKVVCLAKGAGSRKLCKSMTSKNSSFIETFAITGYPYMDVYVL